MTFLTPFIAAISFAAPPPPDCSLKATPSLEQRVFTNADLDRMAACRYQTGAQSEIGTTPPEKSGGVARRVTAPSPALGPGQDAREADWRAQWRSIDQKARRLRREARELRQEAAYAPRDQKKRPTGRRSPPVLLARAGSLEAEAAELEDEFQERARREGALPGWLRPRAR